LITPLSLNICPEHTFINCERVVDNYTLGPITIFLLYLFRSRDILHTIHGKSGIYIRLSIRDLKETLVSPIGIPTVFTYPTLLRFTVTNA
jgi:hypothetical protein